MKETNKKIPDGQGKWLPTPITWKMQQLPLSCLRFLKGSELAPSEEARILWRASALITIFIHIVAKED